MFATDISARTQIDRIVQSRALRTSETLRHLLKFLADKSLLGEADNLKEYTIGVDAFSKGSTYDPRHDSTVRIQAGRLRQKLTEYYQTEGKDDPIVVDLPKGGFKLNWQPRQAGFSELATPPHPFVVKQHPGITNRAKLWLILGLFAVTAWAVYATLQLQEQRRDEAVLRTQWTPEIETIWRPFVAAHRPLLICISAPLFVELPGYGVFRDATVNRPEDIPNSRVVTEMKKRFKSVTARPLIYFTTIGDANVTFALGRLLASRKADVSIVEGNELSWRQVSENNAIYIGSPKFFNQQLGSMPVHTELYLEPRVGVQNPHPRGQEAAIYTDEYTESNVTGIAYTLVSHTPGPVGNGDVISFAGRNGAGILGAVGMFTNTDGARTLLAKIRKPSGEIPRYYQVLLKVRFEDGVPLETSYILHRELIAVGNK